MKLSIKDEKDPVKAFYRMAEYLKEKYPDGVILSGKLTAYCNLSDGKHAVDQELEIIISSDGAEVSAPKEIAKSAAISKLQQEWERYGERLAEDIEGYTYAKVVAVNYLNTAEERKRRPEYVQERRRKLSLVENEIKRLNKQSVLYKELQPKRYKVRVSCNGGDQKRLEGWSVKFEFEHHGKSVYFGYKENKPLIWWGWGER